MEAPLITVITPSFNNESTIMETVASVLSQDYPLLEYVIVDDGSNNFESEKILRLAREINPSVNIRIVQNNHNMGTPYSLNRGIAVSSGKYIFTLASDDRFHDERVISDWTREFETTGALIITGLRDVFDPDMRIRFRTDPSKKVRKKISTSTPAELFRQMYGTNMIIGCCTAYSRECIEQYGTFNEQYHIIEDYPYFLNMSRKNVKIHLFNRIVVDYRSGGISSQLRFNNQYESESDSIFRNEVLPYAEDKGEATRAYERWKERTLEKRQFMIRYASSRSYFSKMACLFRYGLNDWGMALLFLQERMLLALHRD